ncbi:putative quinol monooxygenase [Streptomyces aureus]
MTFGRRPVRTPTIGRSPDLAPALRGGHPGCMIFIAVKFTARPEYADSWLEHTADFTRATRAEEGNLFFDWSRSVEDPNQYVLLEGFRDGDAGAAHVGSDHFKAGLETMSGLIASVPEIINTEIPGGSWGPMGELSPKG